MNPIEQVCLVGRHQAALDLSDIKLEYIFSHSIGSFFTLLIVYFAVQKLLNLTYSNLAIFAFATCAFEKVIGQYT